MTNIKQTIREQITTAVEDAARRCGFAPVPFAVETPRERVNGDFSANAALLLAKSAGIPPRAAADKLVGALSTEGTYIDRVEVAGPGFINFFLSNRWLYDVLPLVERLGGRYGESDVGGGEKVMVEFVSANPTGPMHMGNARGGALGDAMANVLDFAGYSVTREFYLNDAGNQIEKFGCSLEARYLQLCGVDVPFHEEWYQGGDITARAKEFLDKNGDGYVRADSETRKKALIAFSLAENIEMMRKTLAAYRVDYDVWFRESALYDSGEVDKVLSLLREKGYTYEKEGALWFKASGDGEKDEVLVRANGVPTYFAADIAYHRNKFLTRGFDKVIDVWGADHHGHVARMKTAMEAVGVDPDRLEIVLMQLVRLMRGGEAARMSKRSGKAITLEDLLEEIGIDAARFFFNMRNAGSHFDFDLDLAVEQSNDNPVYYVQYAHARICAIIRLLREEGVTVKPCGGVCLPLLTDDAELALLRKISEFPDEITAAAKTLEPSRMTRYASELANGFHSFYNACRVNVDDENLRDARLKLIDSARIALANVLGILAVDAPERM
ncbi:MAG: arginine--tRNA ligase [Clostridiales bacterium]|jgi:arginyl-tRNA synthetase|nr:arginine--tRNA ligase [Clostridiales bacterium]